MENLTLFFLLMAASFLAPEILVKIRVPYVTSLMLAGALLGANGLGILPAGEAIAFLSQIGLIFLLFIVGLQYKHSILKNAEGAALRFAALNGGLPFLAGYFTGGWLGLGFYPSLALGAVYAASCIATISVALDELKLTATRFGEAVILGLILIDVSSLVLFGVVTRSSSGSAYSIFANIALTLAFIYGAVRLAPALHRRFHGHYLDCSFEEELRIALLFLATIVFASSLLGIQPILGAFVAGFALSDTLKTQLVHAKLNAIAYGLLVPVFFLFTGMQSDLGALFSPASLEVILAINLGLIASKLAGGFLAGWLSKFSLRESVAMGFISLPQLSATLAMMAVGVSIGIFSKDMLTATVIMSMVTVLGGPYVAELLLREKPVRKRAR